MSKYSYSIEVDSGLTPAGDNDFPLAQAKDIAIDEDGKRLDAKLDEISGIEISVPADFWAMDLEPDMSRITTLGIFATPEVGSTIKHLAVRVTGAGTVRFALVSRQDSEDGTEGVLTIEHIFGDVAADTLEGIASLTLDEGYKVEAEGLQFLIMADASIIGCWTANGMALKNFSLLADITNLDLDVGDKIAYNIDKLSPAFQPVMLVEADTITPATVREFAENITERVSEIERNGAGGDTELPEVTEDDNDKLMQVVNGVWTPVAVSDSAIKTYVEDYINTALGGDY